MKDIFRCRGVFLVADVYLYLMLQRSIFCYRGYPRVVFSVTEKYLMLQTRIFC